MVAEGRIAVMRRKFAAWRLRKVAASRLRKYAACVRIAVMRRPFDAARLSNDKPAKRLKTSQRRSSVMNGRQASEASQDKPGHAARQDIHRLNTPSEDERVQTYFDDIDREVLGPNYKRILEVHYALCRRDR